MNLDANRHSLLFLGLILACITCFTASAKTLKGYAQNANIIDLDYAFSAVQDQHGYIWFGNRTGLHRYDGHQLKTFRNDDNTQLTNNYIRSLYIDKNQTLWIASKHGLNRYNPVKQQIEPAYDPRMPKTKDMDVSAMFMDNHGILWLVSIKFNVNTYDPETRKITYIPIETDGDDENAANEFWDIKQDANNDIWIAARDGLYRLEFDRNTTDNSVQRKILKSTKYTTDNSELLSNYIIKLHVDKFNNLWIGTSKGLNYYHQDSKTFTSAALLTNKNNPLSEVNISSFAVDQQARLWISTWGKGVHIISEQQQKQLNIQQGFKAKSSLEFDSFKYNNSPQDDIQNNNIYHLLADNNGLMWMIGADNITKVLTRGLDIDHFTAIPDFSRFDETEREVRDNSSTAKQQIKDIYEDSDGYLWLAGNNGLSRYHPTKHTLLYFFYEIDNFNTLPTSHCVKIFEDKQKNIWIGTQVGLSRFDPIGNNLVRQNFEEFIPNELNLANTEDHDSCAIQDITQDNQGFIWIANGPQLVRFDTNNKEVLTFKLQDGTHAEDNFHQITAIAFDGDNTLWTATQHKGLGKFDLTHRVYTSYKENKQAPTTEINDILIENQDRIWIATDTGLVLHDGEHNFTYLKDKPSHSNTIKSIVLDQQSNLWIGTNDGIKSFNPTTQAFTQFNQSSGFINSNYNKNASFRTNDNRLYFTGSKGVDHFDPQKLLAYGNQQPSKVILTDFVLGNQSAMIKSTSLKPFADTNETFILDKAINYLDAITLDYMHNVFKFEFSQLNFINPKQTRYAFRLKGFDDNWIETDNNNRQATFINIPAGHYQFEVKATKRNGPWSNTKSIDINILPPWWQSDLAYSLYLVTFIALLWIGYRWRTKTIRNRSLALKQQVSERTTTISKLMVQKDQMFANISHEFRTPLTLILNPIDKLISHRNSNALNDLQIDKNHQSIKQNAQRLLRMVEQLLEFAKTENSHQQSGFKSYSLKHTINYLNACFDSLFSSKNLNVIVHNFIDANLSLKPDSLEIMLSNLISNAVKYTPENGHIDISVEHQQTRVAISIKDNGIGIAAEHQQRVFERFGRVEHRQANSTQASTGIGLALVKELVHANGGTIELTSAVNQGSCFTITLPTAEKTTSDDTASINEISNNSKQITALEISNLTNITAAPKTQLTDLNDDANNKPLVLVIDDNQELLELIQTIISPHFNCLLAPNGEQGIEKAREHLPDLVISDLMMPGISGFDVLKTLKSDQLTAHIPVIMLTAKGDAQSRIEGWNNQADEYLAKPFNDQELIARISNILAIRKIISSRYQQQFAQNPQAEKQEEKQEATDNQSDNQPDHPLDNQLDSPLDKVAQAFSQQLEQILANHYQDESLSITTIAEQMALSNRQLIRKTKSIIGMTPIESLRTFRLNKAAELLTEGKTPSTIAYEVGFASHSYFAACFKAQFGCTPTNHQQSKL